MEGSLISYEIGDPRVPKILGNWGPGSLTSYENGDPGSPFSLDTGSVPGFIASLQIWRNPALKFTITRKMLNHPGASLSE